MARPVWIRTAFLTACALAALAAPAADPRAYLIRNARVYTLAQAGVLERASILVQAGKIAAVGAAVKAPAGAEIIDAQGLHVYPGMVNAAGIIGLTEIGAVDVTNDSAEQGDYKPQLLAFSAVHPASEHIPVARANGITTSLASPSGGVIAGQATLLHLDGWTADEMALVKSAAMAMNFPSLGGGRGGRGMGAGRTQTGFAEAKRAYDNRVRELAEWLEKARHYAAARKANPATAADLRLEALVPVVEGRMPVIMSASTARDMRNAVEFSRKEKLKMILSAGQEVVGVADLLKKEGIPVIVGPVVTLPRREDSPYDAAYTVPRDLAKAGVKFAIAVPGSSDVRNLPYEAGYAAAFGLPREEALKAVTLSPAEILGVGDRIGSIEPGKIADLVLTDGDLLEMRTQVKQVFIAGRPASLETRHTRLYQRYLARP